MKFQWKKKRAVLKWVYVLAHRFRCARTGCFEPRSRHEEVGKMLARCYRGKLSAWAALCVVVLCWFYIFPGYRLPSDKEIVDEVLRQGDVWQKNQTGIDLYRFVSDF